MRISVPIFILFIIAVLASIVSGYLLIRSNTEIEFLKEYFFSSLTATWFSLTALCSAFIFYRNTKLKIFASFGFGVSLTGILLLLGIIWDKIHFNNQLLFISSSVIVSIITAQISLLYMAKPSKEGIRGLRITTVLIVVAFMVMLLIALWQKITHAPVFYIVMGFLGLLGILCSILIFILNKKLKKKQS